ncbi:6722_t:CDS:1, partial [Paraglomus brasilianum]
EDDSTKDDELDLVSDLRERQRRETQELQAKQRVVTIKAFVN